ncbi:hypothetical protein [Acidovorax sp. sic0104]|uniref:hypothetical protein n=1 Tax=Acidovorax sp. sic0104 TaxID=2854784 RepID=UPI001C45C48B|nr:hypothetical protein [Acidovorax sp. sic0104]MBV7542425.1 hypothetical protein [Acidovorax sp. sic0104]
MRPWTVFISLLAAAASPLALAQQGLPTPDQFRQWDAKFPPGLYEFVDFDLADGAPNPDSASAPRRVCMDRMNAYLMGRGTYFAEPMKSCDLVGVKLDARGLAMSHHCGDQAQSKRPIIGVIVISEVQEGTFLATVGRQVHAAPGAPQEPLAGTGQAFQRVGSCP